MIHTLFICTSSGELFMEKHWRGYIDRCVCDPFLQALGKASVPEEVPPVIVTGKHYLISVFRRQLFFIAVVKHEVPPLFVVEFLNRVVDMFAGYFGSCTETTIKDNFVTVYQILEEMLDNGFPLTTESNVLMDIVLPPNTVQSMVNSFTGASNVSARLPGGQLSNIPWRRQGVKYSANEIFFDIVEEIDAIIDQRGLPVSCEISGEIACNCRLSGMPDILFTFVNPRILDDVSFHPCVRLKRWEQDKVLSFVPPDGNFKLMEYRVSQQSAGSIAIPCYVRSLINFGSEQSPVGRLDLTVGAKNVQGKTVDSVVVVVPLPKTVVGVNLNTTSGAYSFDQVTKTLRWEVGKLHPQKVNNLVGSLSLSPGVPPPDVSPAVSLEFRITQLALSGLRVNQLNLTNERYKPFKGVKSTTRAGRFQLRT